MSLELKTPHIPLGTPVEEALVALDSLGSSIFLEDDGALRVNTPTFSIAVYSKGRRVTSTWYDDSCGRTSEEGCREKIELYLSRYGELSNWELRLDNGTMRYWFNASDKAAMVYGVANDAIRFNEYHG